MKPQPKVSAGTTFRVALGVAIGLIVIVHWMYVLGNNVVAY